MTVEAAGFLQNLGIRTIKVHVVTTQKILILKLLSYRLVRYKYTSVSTSLFYVLGIGATFS